MQTHFLRPKWAVCLFLLGTAVPCLSQEPGSIFTDAPQPLQPRESRSETDWLRVRAATLVMDGRILARRGQSAKALKRYQRAYRLDPDASVVLKQIVPLALELGRVDVASRYALLLDDSKIDDPFLAERLAKLLAGQHEYDGSLEFYQRALTLHQDQPEARRWVEMRFEMGRLYFLTGQHKLAAGSFGEVLKALENPREYQLEAATRKAILAQPDITYTVMAESFLEAGDFQRATELFRKAAESQTAGWLPLQLARVDYRAGRHDLARVKLEQYVQQRRRFGGQEPYRLLRELMENAPSTGEENIEKRADGKSVVDRFRDWLADDPENSPLLSFVADLSRRHGILLEAAELFEQSLERRSTLEAYRGLIATYRELGDGEKLLNVLGRFVAQLQRLDPLADELVKIVRDRELLNRLLDLGRQQLAANQASRRGVVAACGLMAIDARQYEVADEFFAQLATSESASESELFIHWGLELLLAGESDRAATVFRKLLDAKLADADKAVLLYYLAGALQLSGKTDAALGAARRAAKLRHDIPAFRLRPAWILFNAGRYDEAEIAYAAWLQAFGDDYSDPELRQTVRDARFVMSNICIAGERHAEATEWLEQMLDEFPQDVGVMNDLGYLMVDRGHSLEHALRMIRRAVGAEPHNAAYRDSLGWAYYRLGQFDVAITELKRAVSVDNPDPIILDHLGDAQLAGGDPTAAKETWRRALVSLEVDGPNDELRNTIQAKLRLQPTESK